MEREQDKKVMEQAIVDPWEDGEPSPDFTAVETPVEGMCAAWVDYSNGEGSLVNIGYSLAWYQYFGDGEGEYHIVIGDDDDLTDVRKVTNKNISEFKALILDDVNTHYARQAANVLNRMAKDFNAAKSGTIAPESHLGGRKHWTWGRPIGFDSGNRPLSPDEMDLPSLSAAKTLPNGWTWVSLQNGSKFLASPDGMCKAQYREDNKFVLSKNEYRPEWDDWSSFPESCGYGFSDLSYQTFLEGKVRADPELFQQGVMMKEVMGKAVREAARMREEASARQDKQHHKHKDERSI